MEPWGTEVSGRGPDQGEDVAAFKPLRPEPASRLRGDATKPTWPTRPRLTYSVSMPSSPASVSSTGLLKCQIMSCGIAAGISAVLFTSGDKVPATRLRNQQTEQAHRPPSSRDRHPQSSEISVWDGVSIRTIPGSVRLTYGRPSSPETRSVKYFPRRQSGFLADAALQNTRGHGSSTHVAVLWIQAAGGGHLRSRIAGKWFPDETPNGDVP